MGSRDSAQLGGKEEPKQRQSALKVVDRDTNSPFNLFALLHSLTVVLISLQSLKCAGEAQSKTHLEALAAGRSISCGGGIALALSLRVPSVLKSVGFCEISLLGSFETDSCYRRAIREATREGEVDDLCLMVQAVRRPSARRTGFYRVQSMHTGQHPMILRVYAGQTVSLFVMMHFQNVDESQLQFGRTWRPALPTCVPSSFRILIQVDHLCFAFL